MVHRKAMPPVNDPASFNHQTAFVNGINTRMRMWAATKSFLILMRSASTAGRTYGMAGVTRSPDRSPREQGDIASSPWIRRVGEWHDAPSDNRRIWLHCRPARLPRDPEVSVTSGHDQVYPELRMEMSYYFLDCSDALSIFSLSQEFLASPESKVEFEGNVRNIIMLTQH
ncbi:hypothetical protein BC937DRAFT_89134 [Endogone sp. FLAS-F59071]|nr:hypothetical protein BC937DRAFT_89134 [Endogone sp. FLAS-F59071]|eukprot:RUS18119.1 hypothetical protein BC937DRAFT_89134 [Endogone sp. FLAS-F59071]